MKPPAKRSRRGSAKESGEQKVVVDWLRLKGIGVFSVPNGAVIGGHNKWALVNKLKNEGLLPGAPDLVLINRSPAGYLPVAIEMKRARGGVLSDDQKTVIRQLQLAGWVVLVPEGAADAIAKLEAMGF